MASVINLLMVALCSVFGPGSELISLRSSFCNPTIISNNYSSTPSSSQSRSPSSSSPSYNQHQDKDHGYHHRHHHQDNQDMSNQLNQMLGPLKASQTLGVLIEGAKRGMKECQEQFKNERWNCTPSEPDARMQIFHTTISKGNHHHQQSNVKFIPHFKSFPSTFETWQTFEWKSFLDSKFMKKFANVRHEKMDKIEGPTATTTTIGRKLWGKGYILKVSLHLV